jgi:hypothetical protein
MPPKADNTGASINGVALTPAEVKFVCAVMTNFKAKPEIDFDGVASVLGSSSKKGKSLSFLFCFLFLFVAAGCFGLAFCCYSAPRVVGSGGLISAVLGSAAPPGSFHRPLAHLWDSKFQIKIWLLPFFES